MLRIILGVIAGFIVWSILWVGSDAVISAISPDWYGKNLIEFQNAVDTKQPFVVSSVILIMSLIRSLIFSLIAGFTAALIARENTLSPFLTGVLLLAFGIFIQAMYWNYIPLWYHIPFLLMLIPATYLGGNWRKQK